MPENEAVEKLPPEKLPPEKLVKGDELKLVNGEVLKLVNGEVLKLVNGEVLKLVKGKLEKLLKDEGMLVSMSTRSVAQFRWAMTRSHNGDNAASVSQMRPKEDR